jgi:Flp pilus assembly protein TadG
MLARARPRHGADRGSATLELVILTPALLTLVLLLIAAGRITTAKGQVEQSARDAARSASLTRSLPDAQNAAAQTAQATLGAEHLTCQHLQLQVSGGFTVPAGQPATVHVRLSCTAALGDLALPGLPGSRTETASYDAPLDTYRSR